MIVAGDSVSSAGDVNGDGFDDILIGARHADPNGGNAAVRAMLSFGQESGFGASLELSSLDGANGFVINGIEAVLIIADILSLLLGDINGDGFDDILIGAPGATTNRGASGQSYVVFGQASGFGASLELSTLNGSNGFAINGIDTSDYSGHSVSSAGDINGDGFDDILIGFRSTDIYASGESYVVFGQAGGFGASLDLSALSDGFVINGMIVMIEAGALCPSAGDINGGRLLMTFS